MHRISNGWRIAGVPRSPDGSPDRWRPGVWLWTGLIVGTSLAAAAAYGVLSRATVNPDPFVFAVAAKRLLAGQQLYVDFFEAKPPLATLFYVFPGALGPRCYLAVCWFLAALLTLQGLIWLCWFRPRLPTAAACLWFVALYPATYWDFGWLSTEHMSNLFITGVLLASVAMFQDQRLLGLRCVLVGAATTAAFHCRQNTVLCLLVPLAVIILSEQPARAKLRAFAWLGLGIAVAWAAIFSVVWVVSDLESYFFQVFVFPQRFAQVGGQGDRFHLLAAMGDHSLPALLGASAGLGLLGPHRRLVLIAIPVGILTCLLPPRSHYHYWVNLFPFMAMSLLLGLPRSRPGTWRLELVALAIFSASVFAGLLHLVPIALSPSETEPMDEVATWIDSHAGQGDTLYVYGPMGTEYLQFRSRLLPANKYTVGWEIDVNDGMVADSFADILGSYLRRPPTVFVVHQSQLVEMNRAQSSDRSEMPRSTRLALELMSTHGYDHVLELNGFHVYILRGVADRKDVSASLPARGDAMHLRLDGPSDLHQQYHDANRNTPASCRTPFAARFAVDAGLQRG